MRATISFETDVDQVEGTMGMLVAQEAHNLRAVTDLLEDYIAPQDNVLEKVTVALGLLQETTTQLQQYHQMLISFEKAKFETILPQPASTSMNVNSGLDARQEAQDIGKFNSFLERINQEAADEDPESEEG
tara:strand:+ start:133 stop:525 length:393 start_codon:yes stop_codon:yes gene_type:complete